MLTFIKVLEYISFTVKLIIVFVIKGQGQMFLWLCFYDYVFMTIFKCNMRQGYEGVEPYINDLQSKCIAVCNISLFFAYSY